eukprot:TRINITY_DN2398_c0_g1_i23.p1 TRINITY_DN2398_c0_g1~~TRINITY_DN2398_c0_g1_i23.p1  ORF type:complete len:182 (+),score=17.21 TRINITY_DN2398_c0_g1_i23:154-699(+)
MPEGQIHSRESSEGALCAGTPPAQNARRHHHQVRVLHSHSQTGYFQILHPTISDLNLVRSVEDRQKRLCCRTVQQDGEETNTPSSYKQSHSAANQTSSTRPITNKKKNKKNEQQCKCGLMTTHNNTHKAQSQTAGNRAGPKHTHTQKSVRYRLKHKTYTYILQKTHQQQQDRTHQYTHTQK